MSAPPSDPKFASFPLKITGCSVMSGCAASTSTGPSGPPPGIATARATHSSLSYWSRRACAFQRRRSCLRPKSRIGAPCGPRPPGPVRISERIDQGRSRSKHPRASAASFNKSGPILSSSELMRSPSSKTARAGTRSSRPSSFAGPCPCDRTERSAMGERSRSKRCPRTNAAGWSSATRTARPGPAILWVTEIGLPVQPNSWEAAFARASRRCANAGVPLSVNPHQLRHTFAVHMLAMLIQHRLRDAAGEARSATWKVIARLLGDPLSRSSVSRPCQPDDDLIYLDHIAARADTVERPSRSCCRSFRRTGPRRRVPQGASGRLWPRRRRPDLRLIPIPSPACASRSPCRTAARRLSTSPRCGRGASPWPRRGRFVTLAAPGGPPAPAWTVMAYAATLPKFFACLSNPDEPVEGIRRLRGRHIDQFRDAGSKRVGLTRIHLYTLLVKVVGVLRQIGIDSPRRDVHPIFRDRLRYVSAKPFQRSRPRDAYSPLRRTPASAMPHGTTSPAVISKTPPGTRPSGFPTRSFAGDASRRRRHYRGARPHPPKRLSRLHGPVMPRRRSAARPTRHLCRRTPRPPVSHSQTMSCRSSLVLALETGLEIECCKDADG